MKKVIVTGGTGFVAGWVIVEFLEAGYQVATSIRSTSKISQLTETFEKVVTPQELANLSFFEADLTQSAGWVENMRGAQGVIHVASPMGNGTQTVDELVSVAKNGALTVLRAAKKAGVKRIVMTSSQAASTPEHGSTAVLDESFWTDIHNPDLDPYRISKVESERAAWQYARANQLALTTILPGAIFGPILSSRAVSSDRILGQLLHGLPMIPHVPLEISDVRDLAHLHRLAFESDVAIDQRYLAASQTMSMADVARCYQNEFPEKKIKIRLLPNWGTKVVARFVPSMRSLVPMLNRQSRHTTRAAEHDLGWTQHRPEETVIDTAHSLIDFGLDQSV
ncbi:NAD-dependent epimerase/dehydratase family protein [Lactiplantibacillus paraplantarum]|uniref:NAD-dependent epimerase/dehydratase family protein n=1 Tax=Lactiplantibacillus paraplantarum TaxID=60520 RepID=A0A4Q9XZ32_9LACO|nr:NAD-dependent epimerase/dehydratase family protein [Lactiplantibacillus paraplantarum]